MATRKGNQVIPVEAVEAAWDKLHENPVRPIGIDYAELEAALEAATPHMLDNKRGEMKLVNEACTISRCTEAARYNWVIQGHPNGDMAASYCHEHIRQAESRPWDESPTPYSITITGPIGGTK